jgi:hypothetical protein
MKIIASTKNLKISLLILLIVPLSCEQEIKPGKFINDTPFIFRNTEPIKISDSLYFHIDKIYDSRCPEGLYCFWAGNVELLFNIVQNSNRIDTMICNWACDNNPFSLAGYTWKILEVTPYPQLHKKIDPDDYTIKMVITKN